MRVKALFPQSGNQRDKPPPNKDEREAAAVVRVFAEVASQSREIAALCAEVRSERNRAARARRSDREADYLNRLTRVKREKTDRDLERSLRFRIRLHDHEHPKISGRTARNLFHRSVDILKSARIKPAWEECRSIQSLYVQWSARGLSGSRVRAWRPGEADRHARYILREDALEMGEEGWTSNIGSDRTEIVAFWRTLEQIERLNRKNANVYLSIIVPLPHQLSAEQRRDLVRGITAPLEGRGLPFVAAIHLPDARGDDRNYHLHLQLSCRPMERLGPYDWDFSAATHAGLNTPAGIRMMRRHFVRQMNESLKSAGYSPRFTHLTRAERGEPPGEMKRARGKEARKRELERRRDNLATLRDWAERLLRHASCIDDLSECVARSRSRFLKFSDIQSARLRVRLAIRGAQVICESLADSVTNFRAHRDQAALYLAQCKQRHSRHRAALNIRWTLKRISNLRNLVAEHDNRLSLQRDSVEARMSLRLHREAYAKLRLTNSIQAKDYLREASNKFAVASIALSASRHELLSKFASTESCLSHHMDMLENCSARKVRHRFAARLFGLEGKHQWRDALDRWRGYTDMRSSRAAFATALFDHAGALRLKRRHVGTRRSHFERVRLGIQARNDPARIAAVEDAAELIKWRALLPLVRAEKGFAIHPEFTAEPDLVAADRFDAEPQIQHVFRMKWQSMLTELGTLNRVGREPPAYEKDGLLLPANLKQELRLIVEPVVSDAEVQGALLKALNDWKAHQRLIQRERQKRKDEELAKARKRRAAVKAVVTSIMHEMERTPASEAEIRAISEDLNAILRELLKGSLGLARDGETVAFYAQDENLRPATLRVMKNPMGRRTMDMLIGRSATFAVNKFSWTGWKVDLPTSSKAHESPPEAEPQQPSRSEWEIE